MRERPRESRLQGLAWLLRKLPVALRAERCTRAISPLSTCSRCVDVCRRRSVELRPHRSKLVPTFLSTCDECGVCARECPNAAIVLPGKTSTSRRELLTGWLVPRAPHQPARTRWTLTRSGCDGCGVCEKLCPVGALDILARAPRAEAPSSLCTGCGLCVDVCNQKAISVRAYEPPLSREASSASPTESFG